MKKGSIEDGVVYHAGFPNAAEDSHGLPSLGLESLLVQHRASTFLWRLDDLGIEGFGWPPRAIVVVDRALSGRHGDTLVIVRDNEFVARKLQRSGAGLHLITPDGARESIENVVLWGVVTYLIAGVRP